MGKDPIELKVDFIKTRSPFNAGPNLLANINFQGRVPLQDRKAFVLLQEPHNSSGFTGENHCDKTSILFKLASNYFGRIK